MRLHELLTTVMVLTVSLAGTFGQYESPKEEIAFKWPAGKRGAVSLSFDDARPSQLDQGIPIFDKYDIKVTFYVNPPSLKKRALDWRAVARSGHEIGNHSLNHPCSGNFAWSRDHPLEEYSTESIRIEIDSTDHAIEQITGIQALTFAYPCGQKFIGRGRGVRSYVPLVAEHFLAGRGWMDEAANDPSYCDLAQIMGMELDGLSFETAKDLMEEAMKQGRWLVFCGHDIGTPKVQTTRTDTLEAICKYSTDPENGIWLDTVATVARYIRSTREGQSR